MRLTATLALTLTLVALTGCASARQEGALSNQASSASRSSAPNQKAGAPQGTNEEMIDASLQKVSLQQADASQNAPVTVERKIIRDASVSLEVAEPSKAMQRVATVAESRGGFVVTSESRQQADAEGGRAYEVITMELRVPAAQFDAAMNDIRAGGRVTAEKITGQDVTEEYIDLEARLRTQRALEAQLLEIMKQSHQVSDALAVQRELANVRTEIERVEGRRRFLENQASLSTINVTLQPPAPFVSTTGFFHSLRSAFGDGIDIAAAITLVLIRAVLAIIPLAVFFGVPLFFLWRFFARRARRRAAVERELALEREIQTQPAGEHPTGV